MSTYLCTEQDVVDFWSQAGTDARLDDNRSGARDAGETSTLQRIIARVSAVLLAKLTNRYSLEDLTGASAPTTVPDVVRHFAAVYAAYFTGARRNLPQNGFIKAEYERCLEMVEQIISYRANLPGLADSYEVTPFVTNFMPDLSYRSAKIRRVETTSTGGDPPPDVKSHPERLSPFPYG